MKTNTGKIRCDVFFSKTWLYTCCLIFMIVCFVAQSNANTIDFEYDPAFGSDNNVASADDGLKTDDPVERDKIVLIKSQENMSDDWNKGEFWSTGATPYSAKDSIFIVPGGMRVRSRNNMNIQYFGKENTTNSLYIGYDADGKTISTENGILHLKAAVQKDDSITINDLVIGNGEVFQGAANAHVTLNGNVTINGDAVFRLKAEATTSTERRSFIVNSTISGGGNLTFLIEDDKDTHVSLMSTSSESNPFTGNVTIAPNTGVTLSGEDAFCNAASFTNNGTLYLGADQTLRNLSGSGTIDVGTHKLTIYTDQDSLITGAVAGKDLAKTGDGTLQIITSAEGAVRAESFVISSGRLDMEGYFEGPLKVTNDAVVIEDATTFSPGVGVGAIDIDGDLILADGAVLLMEIGGTTFSLNDQLLLNGQVTFEEGAIVQFALAADSDYTPEDGDRIAVNMPKVDWTTATFSSEDFSLDYYDEVAGLQYVKAEASVPTKRIPAKGPAAAPVPEPSTWALLILGVAGLFFIRKKRA